MTARVPLRLIGGTAVPHALHGPGYPTARPAHVLRPWNAAGERLSVDGLKGLQNVESFRKRWMEATARNVNPDGDAA